MRRISGVFALTLVLVLLAACGGAGGGGGDGGTTGGRQSTDPGDTVEFEFSTEGGRQVEGTASTGVPPDFPLPVYPEWTVMGVAEADIGGGVRWNGSFQFEGDVGELTQRYAEELRSIGYDVEVIELSSDMRGLEISGTLDGSPVDGIISIGKAGDMHVININFGQSMD